MRKIYLFLLLSFVGIGLLVLYQFYVTQPASLDGSLVDFKIVADDLYDAFDSNEQQANEKYAEKIVLVTGEILKIRNGKNQCNIVLKAKNALVGGVNCSFSKSCHNLKVGDRINILGRCQGVLLDVILNNCIVLDDV